jgi:hypothetical protein
VFEVNEIFKRKRNKIINEMNEQGDGIQHEKGC